MLKNKVVIWGYLTDIFKIYVFEVIHVYRCCIPVYDFDAFFINLNIYFIYYITYLNILMRGTLFKALLDNKAIQYIMCI